MLVARIDRPARHQRAQSMFAPWNPEGNPVHFLIELHDILQGGFDRFREVSSEQESLVAAERKALEELRVLVHNQINSGVVIDALISDTMSFFRNRVKETSADFDGLKVECRIYDMANGLEALSNSQPVRLSDARIKNRSPDEKAELVSDLNALYKATCQANLARQALLKLLGNLGCAAPREIAIRSTSGEEGYLRFRDLKPEVPTYRGEEMPSSKGAIGNFEQDYYAKYSPTLPKDIHSNPKDWTLKQVVAVCRLPQAARPESFGDPRAVYLTLVGTLEQQLWIELSSQQQARKESRIFRKNIFVREVLSALEGEIRVDHGRLQPTNAELLKSVFEPLKHAVQIMQEFVSATPNNDSEMALDRFVEESLGPAKAEFAKYALHCHGVSTPAAKQVGDDSPSTVNSDDANADDHDREPTLKPREETILREMYSAKAFNRRSKLTQPEIVEKCERNKNASSWKRYFSNLVSLKYLNSNTGPDGGHWLTTEGQSLAKTLLSDS